MILRISPSRPAACGELVPLVEVTLKNKVGEVFLRIISHPSYIGDDHRQAAGHPLQQSVVSGRIEQRQEQEICLTIHTSKILVRKIRMPPHAMAHRNSIARFVPSGLAWHD